MVGVGELLVAADGLVLGDPLRVVGVVAVGRAAGGDHDAAYAVGQAGVEHVAGAVDVDGVLELAVEPLPGVTIEARCTTTSGRRSCDHVVDAAGVASRPSATWLDAGPMGASGTRRSRADDLVPGRDQAGDDRGAEEAAAAGDEDPSCAPPPLDGGAGGAPARHHWRPRGPAMMSQMPHQPATSAMPPRPSKKVKTSTSPRPALRMPTSKVIAFVLARGQPGGRGRCRSRAAGPGRRGGTPRPARRRCSATKKSQLLATPTTMIAAGRGTSTGPTNWCAAAANARDQSRAIVEAGDERHADDQADLDQHLSTGLSSMSSSSLRAGRVQPAPERDVERHQRRSRARCTPRSSRPTARRRRRRGG